MKAEDKIKLEKCSGAGTAWRGHGEFAYWLVEHIRPDVVVDLGVGQGYSTFVFANPNIGHVYGIDWFEMPLILDVLEAYKEDNEINNLTFIKGDISDIVKTWDKPIDILHIDGTHDYGAVKRDFNSWSTFVRDTGVILMHDTVSYLHHVGKLFAEIGGYHKLNFKNSEGLGVLTKDEGLMDAIRRWQIENR